MPFFKNRNFQKIFAGIKLGGIWSVFILLLGISCNKTATVLSSNADWNSVLDSANRVYDANKQVKAVHYLDSATARYKHLELLQKFEYYAFDCNYFFHFKKDNNRAMLYTDTILNLFDTPEKKQKYMAKYGQACIFKGDVLFEENKYSEAYQYYYQGKMLGNKSLNNCTLSDYSYRMGMIMFKQEHYHMAAANFKTASTEITSCDLTFRSFYRRQELLNNTGLCYSRINEADSAMLYYKKALDYIDENTPRFKVRKKLYDVARGVIYGNEAKIYIQQNKFEIAKALLKKSSEINLQKGNDNQDAELSELKLAHLYYKTNQNDSLINLLRVVQKQLDTIKNQDAEADWNFLMANYYIKKHNHETALNYFVTYNTLKDSIENKNKALKEADIAKQIKQLEKDYEFTTLKKDNRLQDMYLKIAAVFGVMLLVIIFLILLTWQKSRKNVKLLGSLNYKINDQNNSLASTLNELKLSSQEKDRILRTVAHDLRNPIGGIASLTLAMADDDYTDEQKELINLIRETSQNSLELINEILEATNNGQTLLNRELVEINSLVTHSVELLRFKAAEKNQEIKLAVLEKPMELLISREKIWRVVSNLISNAIKFSAVGGIIYVKIVNHVEDVQISVKDTGIGIPENMQPKVFNMFTEAQRPGTSGEKSFGLGLSISKQIIENHNGKIGFESQDGKGTTFFIKLLKQK
jgi:signal transduction histidine kinase